MKAVRLTLLAASLLLYSSVASRATGIYQMEYRYSFDGIARSGAPRLTFVMCDETCEVVPSLIRAPKNPSLSVRVSQDEVTVEGGDSR